VSRIYSVKFLIFKPSILVLLWGQLNHKVSVMAHHILGQSRIQTTLFPEVLDDFVTEDNSVRVVDVFVEGLDLEALEFKRVVAKDTGPLGYHRAILLKLYIDANLNRIQSSRRLEKESHPNVELMGLLSRLMPDFKTIADF